MAHSLPALRANAKRLRRIYVGVALAGVAIAAIFALLVASGSKEDGPIIVSAILGFGLLAIGVGLLVVRVRIDARVLQALLERPQSVRRVAPKRTESAVHGSTVATYSWLVLELTDGSTMDVYTSADDFRSVLAEVRRCAPDAEYDDAWSVERTNLHLR